MAQNRINPGLILALIVCVILTLAFTILVIVKTGGVRDYVDGNTEKRIKPLAALEKEAYDERKAIADMRTQLELRERALAAKDVDAATLRLYYRDEQLLAGVSDLPEAERAKLKDQPKHSHVRLAKDAITATAGTLQALRDEYASDVRQKFPSLEQAIAKRQDDLARINQALAQQEADFTKDRAALQEQMDKLNKERDKIEKKQREDNSARSTKIAQLEDQIRKLLELEMRWLTEIEPVGKVVKVEERTGRMVINLGAKDRVFPGLPFVVFNYERGRYQEKALVEAVEVDSAVAVCRALSVTDGRKFPVADGDYLGNPVYSPSRPRVFVFAGYFARYDRPDLEAFVRRAGGVVRESLSPGVDFLVVRGDEKDFSEKARAKAREYQVLGMTEAQLLKFVPTQFAPK